MGVLQDFERRLEGAVEGFFARAMKSGLQPIELAKALQRYAEDTQHVTERGVVVPNVYRVSVNPKDAERLETYGDQLRDELAEVVTRTASEHGWQLRGPALIHLETSEHVAYGRFELAGRVEAVEGHEPPAPAAPRPPPDEQEREPEPPARATPSPAPTGPNLRVVNGPDAGEVFTLTGSRMVAGRLPDNPICLTDQTVSREHAAFVRRGDTWWVLDLGSTNGTRVNDVRAAEQPLSPGDRVELGEVTLEFVES